ncbi:hydroxymethylglutaryl-CoA synthase [Dellaglioa carnosa]|uniref:hydroxymethylglutaryl-CoA synthase n=1 Tax=Dellaglioa carnosa TaxID=2995136 RepID=UPI0022A87D8B|nr:hydroxymethylglutaryl-CoA synthase [Dellaglioa carnosa]MCZ2492480.1 hydroxymethylglutaryl-CoA synthase [Dellaglioa carnosa]
MKIGIDRINFFTSNQYVDMVELAQARDVDPNKYLIGIGQSKMAVIPATQDVVTLGANAADSLIDDENRDKIDFIIFATESGIDNSKSAGAYISGLLGLSHVRAIEVKQACYGATAAIQLAKGHVALNPGSQVLVIGADIARYGLHTSGEPTQGGGAVAMLITKNPGILALDEESGFITEDTMDFWRPLNHSEALVDGKTSQNVYLDFFNKTWTEYKDKTKLTLSDFKAMLFHLPYTKLGIKGLKEVLLEANEDEKVELTREFEAAKRYNNQVGNLYTGSLYLSFISLLENSKDLEIGDRVGLYSYGSGAVGEFFSGKLASEFEDRLPQINLESRVQVSVEAYEEIYQSQLKNDGADIELDYKNDHSKFVLTGSKNMQRQYLIQ